MTALNSFSIARDLHSYIPEMIVVESSERVLEGKGLFIIPYDTNRLVAFVRAEIDVIDTVNETVTVWSNPPLSFYGYCHIRRYKQSIGNPVQVNQRNQILFQWFPQESLVLASQINSFFSILQLLEAIASEPNKIWLPSPLVTDLSFGFSRGGKFKVTVSIGYFQEGVFPNNSLFSPEQNVPDPEFTESVDPSSYKDLGDPSTPVSPPYRPGDDDFGESTPGTPVGDPPPDTVPFRIRFRFSGPGADPSPRLTVQYSGEPPISINLQPVKVGSNYVATITTESGTVYIPYVGTFVTEEQEQAFLDTFEFIEYVYN